MPLFTGAIAVFAAISTFVGSLGAIGAAVLQAAVGIGLNLIAAAIKGKPKQEPVGIQGKLGTGGDQPRSFIIGLYNTAGSLLYHGAYHQAGDTPNALYAQEIGLSDLPVQAITEYWLDGEKLTVTAGGTYGSRSAQHFSNGDDHLWFRFYDGTQTTADAELVSAFGASDRPYGADMIGTGIAKVIVTALMDQRDKDNPMFKGLPQCKYTVRGIPLYDPSKDSTVGGVGAQRWSDPSTWGGDGDDLPAVQIYNILRGISYNGQWLYGLQNANPAILPAANWIAAINKCRVLVDGPDGPEPQYRSGAQVNVDIAPADLIETLLKTCNGRLTEVGGVYTIHVGEPDAPVMSFTDDDILSSEEQVHNPFRGLADSINGVVAKYPEPLEGWNVKTAPAFENPAQQARDGGRKLFADVDLAAVPYHGQVQRLIKSAMLEALRERRHTIVLPPWAQELEPGDVVRWTSERNGYVNKWFRIDGMAYKANLDVMLQLTEVDPSDYDWDQATDYIPPVFSPMQVLRPAPQPIVSFSAEGFIENDSNGLPRRPGILLTWDGTKSDIRGVSYEIATAASESAIILREITDDADRGAIKVFSQGFVPGQTYYARGRYIPSAPRDTPFSDWRPAILPDLNYGIIDFDEALQKQVTSILDDQFADVRRQMARLATAVQQVLSRTSLDKKEVRSQQVSLYKDNKASIETVAVTAADAQASIASLTTTVAAHGVTINQHTGEIAANTASVEENSTAITTLEGYAASQWSVLADVNGNVAGLILFNEGATKTSFNVIVDKFNVAFPGVSGGDPVPVFTVANVNGAAKCALRGDMLVDGAILARMVGAGEITAVKIQSGSIDSTKIAINGVDILNIVDGAAGYVQQYATAGRTVGDPLSFDAANVSFTVAKGDLVITWSAALALPVAPSGAAYALTATLYVNGSAVSSWTWNSYNDGDPTYRDNFSLVRTVVGVPTGSRNIRIAVLLSGGNGTLDAGQLTVSERRR